MSRQVDKVVLRAVHIWEENGHRGCSRPLSGRWGNLAQTLLIELQQTILPVLRRFRSGEDAGYILSEQFTHLFCELRLRYCPVHEVIHEIDEEFGVGPLQQVL